jgi:hypothetical protein
VLSPPLYGIRRTRQSNHSNDGYEKSFFWCATWSLAKAMIGIRSRLIPTLFLPVPNSP